MAAHAELGPRYEAAVAEGLIERIGEEIDKRVDARLRGAGHAPPPPQPMPPAMPVAMPPPPAPSLGMPPWPVPPPGPVAPPGQLEPGRRSAGATFAGVFLDLGSMGLGVGATAVISSNVGNAAAQVVTILLVWVAIIMVNGIHARFYWPEGMPHRRGR